MPQKHQRVRSLANRKASVRKSAIQTVQAPSVDGWSSVRTHEPASPVYKEVFKIVKIMQSGASPQPVSRIPKASLSALDPPRKSERNRLHMAAFGPKPASSKITSSRTTDPKLTSARNNNPVEDLLQQDITRRSGSIEAIINADIQKNHGRNTLSARHSKQSNFARPHEYVNALSEPTKCLKRYQVARPASPGQGNHPDLEQPPREYPMTNRQAKTRPCAARIPPIRSVTTDVRPFSKSWPTLRSRDHVATLDYHGELRDVALEGEDRPVEHESDRALPTGLPQSQSRHSICPDESDTRLHKPPLIKTDRHHTKLTNNNDTFELATAVARNAKQDLHMKTTARHRYCSGCIEPEVGDDDDDDDYDDDDDDDGNGDDGDDEDEDTDDDEQVGFRENPERVRHHQIAPHAGDASRTREAEYSSLARLPDPRRFEFRRRGSCTGVFYGIAVTER